MNEAAVDQIVDGLTAAAELFASDNPYADQSRRGYSVWWKIVPEAGQQFSGAVEAIRRANPSQLSHEDTARALTYGTQPSLADVAIGQFPVDGSQTPARASEPRFKLANTSVSRHLQLIVHNISIDGPVPALFGVELAHPTEKQAQELYKDSLIGFDIQTN